MSCIDLKETSSERDRRVDCLLREMVVREGLRCILGERPPRRYNLEEISDFVGVALNTISRIEQNALEKIRDKMLK